MQIQNKQVDPALNKLATTNKEKPSTSNHPNLTKTGLSTQVQEKGSSIKK